MNFRGYKKCVVMGGLVAVTLFLICLQKSPDGKRGHNSRNEGKYNQEQTMEAWEEKAQIIESSKGKIALTFDDGPHPSYTGQLLDGLKERGVHVTFFVTGEHATLHPELIKRMHEEGHLIGNHTYNHIQLKQDNREEFKEQLIQTNEIIESITGEEVQYVRPPYGIWCWCYNKVNRMGVRQAAQMTDKGSGHRTIRQRNRMKRNTD